MVLSKFNIFVKNLIEHVASFKSFCMNATDLGERRAHAILIVAIGANPKRLLFVEKVSIRSAFIQRVFHILNVRNGNLKHAV